jgi:hypothetical protein
MLVQRNSMQAVEHTTMLMEVMTWLAYRATEVVVTT